MKIKLGRLVFTEGVANRMVTDVKFYMFIGDSLDRYVNTDWGKTKKKDRGQNDKAVFYGGRIQAVYQYDYTDEGTIWIITEWDRSVTTVLFPDEY